MLFIFLHLGSPLKEVYFHLEIAQLAFDSSRMIFFSF